MNRKLTAIALILALLIGVGVSQRAEARAEVTLDVFYDALTPYGEWVEHDYYGYIWQPVGVDEYWKPYRDGNWQYSDEGWIWVSDEPWGWATYHYGRWVPDDYYGWVWIPGVDWAPAYVEWYDSPGYIGWSPRPPDRNFFLEIGISIGGYGYYQPSYYGGYNYYKPYYYGGHKHHKKHHRKHHYYDHAKHSVYVPYEHFSRKNAKLVAIEGSHNTVVYKNTKNINNVTVINNRNVYKGPDRHVVEHRSGKKIKRVNVVDRDLVQVRGKGNVNELRGSQYNTYRPKVVKKGYEKPTNISKRYNGSESFKSGSREHLEKKGINKSNTDTVVNRGARNLSSDFNGREGYQKGTAQKYTPKSQSNKSKSHLSPAKNHKQINRNKISTQYQSPKRSQLNKNTGHKTQVQRSPNQSQYKYKPKENKLSGKSNKNLVSPRNYNAQNVNNNRKPYKTSNKSLTPAKSKKSQTVYKTKKPNVNKAQRHQKSFSANKTNQQVNRKNTNKVNSYKKTSKKNSSKTTTTRNVTNRNVNKSFKSSQGTMRNRGNNSFNTQVRR